MSKEEIDDYIGRCEHWTDQKYQVLPRRAEQLNKSYCSTVVLWLTYSTRLGRLLVCTAKPTLCYFFTTQHEGLSIGDSTKQPGLVG